MTQAVPAIDPDHTISVGVASFNIRNSSADDGDDSWPHRKDATLDQIRAVDWQFLGMQEVLADQFAFLRDHLSHTEYASSGRDDGLQAGEHNSVFVNSPEWTLESAEVRWLSESPDEPGSIGWDATLPRIVTMTKATHTATGARLGFANTHFCYQGREAQLHSAELIDGWLTGEESDGRPWIVVGDLNIGPDAAPLVHLRSRGWTTALPADEAGSTFHGFTGTTEGEQIDHILLSPGLEAVDWGVERGRVHGRWPSDHYLVRAEVRVPVSG